MKFILSVLVFLFSSQSVLAADSAYTPLDMSKCKKIENSADDPKAEMDYFTYECPGRDGYTVTFAGGDLRSWFVLKKNKVEIFNALNAINSNADGTFAHISAGVLEWRYNGKALSALIVRIGAQNDEKMKDFSRLHVFRHASGQFCYLGKEATNEAAHVLADSAKTCP